MHVLTVLRKAGVLEAELAVIDSVLVRAFGGGDATGPSPVDRGKPDQNTSCSLTPTACRS